MTFQSTDMLLASTLYRPAIAWGLIAVVLMVAVVSGVLIARREGLWWTLVLRVVAVLALGWVLLGYSQTEPGRSGDSALPRLTVLVDESQSMAEQDTVVSPDQPAVSRLQAASDAYLSVGMLNRLGDVARVELMGFDEQVHPTSLTRAEADGGATAVYGAIAQTRADATLILSDGHDTTRQAPPGNTTRAGRLYAVPLGTARSAPDLELQAWPESDRLFEDQSTTITASIQQSGFEGQQAVVELLNEGELIDSKAVTLDQRATTARFRVTPPLQTGVTVQANHYTARVRLAQGQESYPDNNAQDVFIQTSRGQIKVLLLEGEPYWDTRSLARLITGHPRFDLTAIYGFGSDRKARLLGESLDQGTNPTQQIDAFDLVILGRQVQRLVEPTFANRLTKYVRNGGAVVFARGQPFTTSTDDAEEAGIALARGIESISPVQWAEPVVGEMRVRLGQVNDATAPIAGLQDGEVLSRLPGMLAATRIDGRKAASLVMLEQTTAQGPSMAAMTSLRVGSGVTLAVLTEGLWRWELLPGVDPQDEQAQSVYGVLWVRALQWLASGGEFLPGQDISLDADRLTADLDQPINLRVSTRYVETSDLALQLTATHSDGTTQRLTPTVSDSSGTYSASFTPRQTGIYSIALTAPDHPDLIVPGQALTTRLAVIDRSPERRDTSAKPDLLKQLVEPTGGRCLALGEVDPLLDYLQSLQALRGSEDSVDYAFNTWPIFALIAGCLGLEWIFRRRMGLR